MKLTKIYIEGDDRIIKMVLEIVRGYIGNEVRIVDLNPELVGDAKND